MKTTEDQNGASLKRVVRRRYGPWTVKQRPCGDWVIDQLDRETMRVRRFGSYRSKIEALDVWRELE